MKTYTTEEMIKRLRDMAIQILTPGSEGKAFFEAVADRLAQMPPSANLHYWRDYWRELQPSNKFMRYKNGRAAKLGDLVVGTTHNSGGKLRLGTVRELIPEKGPCNVRLLVVGIPSGQIEAKDFVAGRILVGTIRRVGESEPLFEIADDFADCKELVTVMDAYKAAFLPMNNAISALEWIANQPCCDAGEYASCADKPNNLCVSEYCHTCYARVAIGS